MAKIKIANLSEGQAYYYKSKKPIPQGEFVLFTTKDTDDVIWKILQPRYCTDLHLNKIGWVAPITLWVRKLLKLEKGKVPQPNVTISESQLNALFNFDISTRRVWQRELLTIFAQRLHAEESIKAGVIAPLGSGKCLFGLDLCQLGDKALYLAPTYLHGQIKQEAEKFERICPTISTYESAHKFADEEWDVIIGDECSKIKNPDSERTKKFRTLAKKTPIVIGLTGTPTSSREGLDLRWINSFVEDAMPENEDSIKFLFGQDPREDILVFPVGVDDSGEKIMGQKGTVIVSGWDSKGLADFLYGESYTVDVTKLYEEIPGIQYHEIELDTPKHFKLAQKGLFSANSTEMKALAQARQVTSGFYYTEDDTPKRVNTIKIDCIERWLDDNESESVLIYSNFKESQLMLCEHLARYNPARVLSDEGQRVIEEIDRFKRGETRVMVATTAFAYGMNLMDVCNNMFFESLPSSSELFQQAIGRIYRPGQKKFVNIYFLLCRDTLDKTAKELLVKHADVSDAIMREALLNEFKRLKSLDAPITRKVLNVT